MAKAKGRASKPRIELKALALIAVLAVGLLGLVLYISGQGCQVSVEQVCLTTSNLYISATGTCDTLQVRIIDADGFRRAEVTYPLNATRVPLAPGLAPGDYTLEILAGGEKVASLQVKAYQDSYILSASALLMPNGTLIIDTQGYASPCDPDYRIVAIRVFVNDTSIDFTNQTWRVGDRIVLDLGIEVTPNMIVNVVLIDSNGNFIQAKVAYPQ